MRERLTSLFRARPSISGQYGRRRLPQIASACAASPWRVALGLLSVCPSSTRLRHSHSPSSHAMTALFTRIANHAALSKVEICPENGGIRTAMRPRSSSCVCRSKPGLPARQFRYATSGLIGGTSPKPSSPGCQASCRWPGRTALPHPSTSQPHHAETPASACRQLSRMLERPGYPIACAHGSFPAQTRRIAVLRNTPIMRSTRLCKATTLKWRCGLKSNYQYCIYLTPKMKIRQFGGPFDKIRCSPR